MKKLISLVTVIAIIAASSLCAFAADLNADDVAAAQELEGVEGVYTVPASSTGDYATIVAVKGTTIQVGAIQYINQASTAEGAPSFEFALNPDLLAASTEAGIADTKVYVVTGGDGSMNVVGYIETAEEEEPTTATISGKVTGFYARTKVLPTLTLTANNLKDDASQAIVYTVALNSDGTFSQVVSADVYTLNATKAYHTSYKDTKVDATKGDVAYASDITVYVGNVDNRGAINASDITRLVTNFNKSATNATNWDSISYMNLDERGAINATDVGMVVTNFNKASVTK